MDGSYPATSFQDWACTCIITLAFMFMPGDALRATAGMTLGYTSRPFYKMEALLYPIYNAALKAVLPDAVFEVG